MSETINSTVLRTIRNVLLAPEVAGGRVYLHRANPKQPRPYIIITPVVTVPLNMSGRRDFEVQLNIRAVSDDMVSAVKCADEVRQSLTDRGTQDAFGGIEGSDWNILSVSEDQQFSLYEALEDASPVFIEGAIYVIVAEERYASVCRE